LIDEGLEIETVQQFHNVIEAAVVGYAKIIQFNCVWGPHRCRRLGLPFETQAQRLSLHIGTAEYFGPHQLDGRPPRQEPMLCAPHFSHAAIAQTLDELIASQFASAIEFRAQIVDDPRANVCDEYD